MPRLAANLSTMYGELPFLDRFEAAARDGFRAVEFQFPYAWPAAEVAARLRAHGLAQVLFNAPVGGHTPDTIAAAWADGLRGTASLPGREAEFRAGLRLALDYAERIDGPRIHVMAGVLAPGGDRARALALYRANLAWAVAEAARAGRELLIEPINPRDMPGYLLQTQEDAHAVVRDVAGESGQGLKVQMDLYHCQIVEGDVAEKIRRHLPTGRVGHLQIAGVPLRHEPDLGELDPTSLFDTIDAVAGACGWQGWIGCEYRPRAGTSEGLAWARPWLAPA